MRLFFALTCPAVIAAQIADWRDALLVDGQPVRPANLHLTLSFLGQQQRRDLSKLLQLAAAIEAPVFNLQLDQLGLWPDGLLHLSPQNPPVALLQLVSLLQQALSASGFPLEQREYRPHLTLARHCKRPIFGVLPAITWEVSEFSLFLSRPDPAGVGYEALGSWNLRQPD